MGRRGVRNGREAKREEVNLIIGLSWADRLMARQSNTSTQELEWDLTQGQVNLKLRSLSPLSRLSPKLTRQNIRIYRV